MALLPVQGDLENTIKKTLKGLLFKDQEIIVYIALLEGGRQSTTSLSKKLGISRTTLYTPIESLQSRGLLLVEQAPRGKRYNALSFDELLSYTTVQKSLIEDSIRSLESVRTSYENMKSSIPFFPKIKVYDTKEARDIIYGRIQNFKKAYSLFVLDDAIHYFQWSQKKQEKIGEIPKDSYVQEIIVDSPLASEYKKKWETHNKGRHEIKLIDRKVLPLEKTDIMMIDGVFYHTSIGDSVTLIEIHDETFYNCQKAFFDVIWKLCDSY